MLTAAVIAVVGLVLAGSIAWQSRRSRAAAVAAAEVPLPDADRSPVALFELTPEGALRSCNATCVRALGAASAAAALGFDLGRALADETARTRWRRWMAEGGASRIQLRTRLRTKEGVRGDVLITVERVRDGRGVRLSGAITDAGELSASVHALEREAACLREVIAAAPVGIATFEADGRVGRIWNRAAEAILGWPAESVRGEVMPLLPEPRDAGRGRSVDPDHLVTREVRRWRRDGEVVDLSIATAPVGGESAGTVAVLQDITDRVQRESERRRLGEIVRTTPDLVLILDVDGNVLYRNPAARARLEALDGAAPGHLTALGDEWARRWKQEVVPVVVGGSSWTGEVRLGREAGFLASVVVAGHRSSEGRLAYLSVLARDISKQRSVEEQLRQSQKLEAVGQLSGGIAHDFNNLLTVVQANSELLSAGEQEAEEAALLSDIQTAVRRGRDLVKRLMVFSRKETLSLRHYRLDELEDYVRTLRRLLPETVAVAWECAVESPFISADPGALQQVLLNLATNARDAMPEGGSLTIAVREGEPGDGGRETLELAVSDSGTGISPEDLERVFEPFYTTKSAGKGTGLGLAMVYGLVGELGGEIRVDSEVGVGTTFRLVFPRVAAEAAVQDEEEEAAPTPAAGQTLLLVEDEAAIRRVAQKTLQRVGYTVLVAGDGEEGLEQFREHAGVIDLVVSDVVMPKVGGHELLRRLRELGATVPFMFMSGYTERETRQGMAVEEEVTILQKPWTGRDLHAAVAQALDAAAASAVGGDGARPSAGADVVSAENVEAVV